MGQYKRAPLYRVWVVYARMNWLLSRHAIHSRPAAGVMANRHAIEMCQFVARGDANLQADRLGQHPFQSPSHAKPTSIIIRINNERNRGITHKCSTITTTAPRNGKINAQLSSPPPPDLTWKSVTAFFPTSFQCLSHLTGQKVI